MAALFIKKEGIGGIAKIALSFGLSIAVVPIIGLILNYTPWGIRIEPALLVFDQGESHNSPFCSV